MPQPSKIKASSSRNNPIQTSICRIRNYPKTLIYYKVGCSRFYWARVYMYGRYHFKSLKTEDKQIAKEKTIDFYHHTLGHGGVGKGSLASRKFASVGHAVMSLQETTGSKRRHYDDLNLFTRDLIPFFGEMDVGNINNAKINDFIKALLNRGLSPSTVKRYLVALRKILKYAAENNLINSIPTFPQVRGSSNVTKRDYFELEEYKHLCDVADHLARSGTKVRGIPITEELKLLMQFMLNTFIRPSDLRVIKHENIQIKTNPNAKKASEKRFLYLTHEKTKTTDTEVVSMPAAVPVYEALLKLQKSRTRKDDPTKHYGLKSDYVFFPQYQNRTTMMAVVGRQFRKAVETAEITNEGEIHTLYSLRHSAIMYRLIKGDVDTLTLARNARTSQEMIDRFYASRLTALMNLDKLHSFK